MPSPVETRPCVIMKMCYNKKTKIPGSVETRPCVIVSMRRQLADIAPAADADIAYADGARHIGIEPLRQGLRMRIGQIPAINIDAKKSAGLPTPKSYGESTGGDKQKATPQAKRSQPKGNEP